MADYHLDNIANYSAVASSTGGDSVGLIVHSPPAIPSSTKEYAEEIITFPDYSNNGYELVPLSNISKNAIMEQIDKLKRDRQRIELRMRELAQQAESTDPGKTAIVLLNHDISKMILTLETSKQLEHIANGTLDEGYLEIDIISEKKVKPTELQKKIIPKQPTKWESSGDSSGYSTEQSSLIAPEFNSSKQVFIDETLAAQIVSTFQKQIKMFRKEDERLRIGSRDSVEYAFKIAQMFPENEQIEEGLCGFLNAVAMTNKQGLYTLTFIYEDLLDYLSKVFNKHWKDRNLKSKLFTDIIGLFFQFSHSASTVRKLMNDKYIDILLRPFKSAEFSNINVLCGISLLNLMQLNGGQDWNSRKSSADVEKIILEEMKKWELGRLYPVSFNRESFTKKLNEVGNPSLLIRQLNLWLIANATQRNNKDKQQEIKENCEILRNSNAVKTLKEVLKEKECTPELKECANFALTNLKKKKLLFV